MRKPLTIENDKARVASLRKMNLLSTPREADLDKVTRLAQMNFGTEMAMISLVDESRQWFKSRRGVNLVETPRDTSFCGHAVHDDNVFIVSDAHRDERFHDNPLVLGDPWIRFYAGKPLTNQEGHRIGTLCVVSSQTKSFSSEEIVMLGDLGRMAEVIIENRELSETQLALLDSLEAAQRDTMLDPLSGLWNRRGLDELLEREIARAVRDKGSIAVGLLDIDHFKKINDQFGHPVGDEVIKLTADLLTQVLRSTDVIARYGGEEFVFVSPNIDSGGLLALGKKIVASIRSLGIFDVVGRRHRFTASLGLVSTRPASVTPGLAGSLIEKADQAMYAAKAGGRDCFRAFVVRD